MNIISQNGASSNSLQHQGTSEGIICDTEAIVAHATAAALNNSFVSAGDDIIIVNLS